MNDWTLLLLGFGISFGMVWDRRTGYGCGGLISPGLVALSLSDPWRLAAGLVLSLLVWVVLKFCVRQWGWYGRMRVGFAMLIALLLRCLAGHLLVIPHFAWLGWVVPGLIAADIQRQGFAETLCGLTCTSITAAFAAELTSMIWGAIAL